MDNLLENEDFFNGIVVGINLYQQKVITAHERKESLKIGEEFYYLQNGRERLLELFDKVCK